MEPEERVKRIRKIRKRKRARMAKFRRFFALFFVASLVIVAVLNLVVPDRKFSGEENRNLAQKPALTRTGITTGKFMENFENYFSDQFVGRDMWISIKLTLERASGKRESNGVYLGKKGHLLEQPNEPSWDDVQKNMNAVQNFASRHSDLNINFCLVPNAFYIQSQYLPKDAPVRDQRKDIERIKSMAGSVSFLDPSDTLKEHSDEYIYYKTDHHWTSLGASYAFSAIAGSLGIENPETEYQIYTVSDDFQGTLSSKSGYHGTSDTVQVFKPKGEDLEYVVEYVDTGEKTTSIFDSSALKEKDKYQVFFGGNHAQINITTTNTEGKNLLIFKDSYANCFVQFLLPYYQSITIIDPRYYYDNIDTLVSNSAITDVLFLYNVNSFVTDNSLGDVLAPSDSESESETEEQGTESINASSSSSESVVSDSAEAAGAESVQSDSSESAEAESVQSDSSESAGSESANPQSGDNSS